jgi:hypothetical protein
MRDLPTEAKQSQAHTIINARDSFRLPEELKCDGIA